MYCIYVCRFDQVLDGGLYTGEVTEIAGEIASGKTQVSNMIDTGSIKVLMMLFQTICV